MTHRVRYAVRCTLYAAVYVYAAPHAAGRGGLGEVAVGVCVLIVVDAHIFPEDDVYARAPAETRDGESIGKYFK